MAFNIRHIKCLDRAIKGASPRSICGMGGIAKRVDGGDRWSGSMEAISRFRGVNEET